MVFEVDAPLVKCAKNTPVSISAWLNTAFSHLPRVAGFTGQCYFHGVRFTTIPGLTKTRSSGPPLEAFYSEFPEERELCPVETPESL